MAVSRVISPVNARAQRGAVLFVAMIFLILLTLLGLAASSTSILQERMTGGMRSQQLGLMGAESALRGGEFAVWGAALHASLSTGGDALPPCPGGAGAAGCLYDRPGGVENSAVTTFRTSKTWASTPVAGAATYAPTISGFATTDPAATASIASQPRYLLEDLGLDTSGNGSIKGRMGGARDQELGGPGGAPPRRLYRVTATSQGGNVNGAVSAVESVYSAYGTNHQYNPDAPPAP